MYFRTETLYMHTVVLYFKYSSAEKLLDKLGKDENSFAKRTINNLTC